MKYNKTAGESGIDDRANRLVIDTVLVYTLRSLKVPKSDRVHESCNYSLTQMVNRHSGQNNPPKLAVALEIY